MSKLFVIFVFITFCGILCPSVCGQVCNSAAFRQFDSNMAKLLTIGNSGRRFPENKGQDLKTYCDDSIYLGNQLDNYRSRCLKDAAKQVGGVLIYAIKSAIRQMCKKDSQRLNKLIVATPCLNQGNSDVARCYAILIDELLGIQNGPDSKKWIPMLCCANFKSIACIEKRLLRVSKCDASKVDAILDFVLGVAGSFLDLACGDYSDDSDKCTKLGPPPRKRKDQRRTKSFAIPLMDILKAFPEV